MNARDELMALRRLKELETKAGKSVTSDPVATEDAKGANPMVKIPTSLSLLNMVPGTSGIKKSLGIFGQGISYGAVQQPRDIIASGIAKSFGGVPFKDALSEADRMSLEGEQGKAKAENEGAFGAGRLVGNISATAVPSSAAANAVGGALRSVGAKALGSAIGAGSGFVGLPLRGAVEGAVSSTITEGDPIGGALGGSIGSSATGVIGKIAKPVGSVVKPSMQKLAKLWNIDLTPAQATGNRFLERVEAQFRGMPFTSGKQAAIEDKQAKAFTKAVIDRAGLSMDDVSPESLAKQYKELGNAFDSVLPASSRIGVDDNLAADLDAIGSEYARYLPSDIKQSVVQRIDDIKAAGELSGDVFRATRSAIGKQAEGTSDANAKIALVEIQSALDDAAERSLPEGQSAAYKEVRRAYRNFLPIQDTMKSRAGVVAEDTIPVGALIGPVVNQGGKAFARGAGDLNSLARLGYTVLRNKSNSSGTAENLLAQKIVSAGLGAAGGGAIGYATGQDPVTTAGLAVAGLSAPRVMQELYYSPLGAAYLKKGIPGAEYLQSKTARTVGSLFGANM